MHHSTNSSCTRAVNAQAALATPQNCGAYTSTAKFTPWDTSSTVDALWLAISQSQRDQVARFLKCLSVAVQPDDDRCSTTDQAGGYTDFTMFLCATRDSNARTLLFKTPEGLFGMIARVPLCEEPQQRRAHVSASRSGIRSWRSVPAVSVCVARARTPTSTDRLTGPNESAPFGLSIVVPMVAGPFNLGTGVVRATIAVDPHTSQLRSHRRRSHRWSRVP